MVAGDSKEKRRKNCSIQSSQVMLGRFKDVVTDPGKICDGHVSRKQETEKRVTPRDFEEEHANAGLFIPWWKKLLHLCC